MFSQTLFKFSSLVFKNTNFKSKINSIVNSVIRPNVSPSPKWLNSYFRPDFNYEMPPLMKFDAQKYLFPAMIPPKTSLLFKLFVKQTYNEQTFIETSKNTVSVISSHLSNNEIDSIKNMVTEAAFEELSQSLKNFSPEQKRQLKIDKNDIIQAFVLGMRFKRLPKAETAFQCKIVVMIDVLSDLANPTNQKILSHIRTEEFNREFIDFQIKCLEPLLDNKYLCIYEFSREYGSGSREGWLVSRIVHYKYKDLWRSLGFIK